VPGHSESETWLIKSYLKPRASDSLILFTLARYLARVWCHPERVAINLIKPRGGELERARMQNSIPARWSPPSQPPAGPRKTLIARLHQHFPIVAKVNISDTRASSQTHSLRRPGQFGRRSVHKLRAGSSASTLLCWGWEILCVWTFGSMVGKINQSNINERLTLKFEIWICRLRNWKQFSNLKSVFFFVNSSSKIKIKF
jgi:hypothetical protein